MFHKCKEVKEVVMNSQDVEVAVAVGGGVLRWFICPMHLGRGVCISCRRRRVILWWEKPQTVVWHLKNEQIHCSKSVCRYEPASSNEVCIICFGLYSISVRLSQLLFGCAHPSLRLVHSAPSLALCLSLCHFLPDWLQSYLTFQGNMLTTTSKMKTGIGNISFHWDMVSGVVIL